MRLLSPTRRRQHRFDRDRRQLNIAHRGASAYAPENTIAAIRTAQRMGADMVEVDVQRSRDGALVLIHDETLDRTTNARIVFPDREPWRVSDFTYDELLRLDAGVWKSPNFAGAAIPTLADALAVLATSTTGLLIELKSPELYPGIVADLAAELDGVARVPHPAGDADRIIVQSFNIAAMKEYKTLHPTIPVGLLGVPSVDNLAALATWADQVNPQHRSVERDYVERVHESGLDCLVWTVNTQPDLVRALRMGADGIITNRPDALRDCLTGRSLRAMRR